MVRRGFTLIELLVVLAILGVLSVIVFVAVNPTEKLAQSRDSGRISSVTQLGKSIQAYYTANEASFPPEDSWAQELVDKGELSAFPSGIEYTKSGISACSTYAQPAVDPTYCYDLDTSGDNGAIVFSVAESVTYRSKCTDPEQAYFVFSSADGRGGTICSNGDPTAWASGSMTYQD